MKKPKASTSGPFDPARTEQLREQLVDLLAQIHSERVQAFVVLEHLLVALIAALTDPPAKAKS